MEKDFLPLLMMRVARAEVGVDCGGGNATEREPWTQQQQHILTQETEEAVLVFFLSRCPLDAFVFRQPPLELPQLPSQTAGAGMDDMSEVRDCEEKRGMIHGRKKINKSRGIFRDGNEAETRRQKPPFRHKRAVSSTRQVRESFL